MHTANLNAFLGMLAISEIGGPLLAASDDGYNVIVGSTAKSPILFNGYADHPRRRVPFVGKVSRTVAVSTAAGRYQILERIFDHYKTALRLPDFGKASQDAIAIRLIGECKALGLIQDGKIEEAIHACRSRWASLPGASYGQNEHKLGFLVDAFRSQGGTVTK
jgi:muramidase (phage lysozyme)